MLDITVIGHVLCILMVEIVEMYVIAKTTPFVIQPAENAHVHPAFWAKSKWFFLHFLWKIINVKIIFCSLWTWRQCVKVIIRVRCHFNLQNIMQKYWQNFFFWQSGGIFFLLIFPLFWCFFRCDQKCPHGFYGKGCQYRCKCQNGAKWVPNLFNKSYKHTEVEGREDLCCHAKYYLSFVSKKALSAALGIKLS